MFDPQYGAVNQLINDTVGVLFKLPPVTLDWLSQPNPILSAGPLILPLAYFALQVLGARDPRRFVAGYVVAAVGWFAILYPNIAALPLPASIVRRGGRPCGLAPSGWFWLGSPRCPSLKAPPAALAPVAECGR